MKQCPVIVLLCLTAMLAPLSPAHGAEKAAPSLKAAVKKTSRPALNVLELANSQTYRYGREMYLSRRYAEAVKVFAEILRLDCRNKLAHYHLQKIAEEAPAFAYLKEQLKAFPCGTPDFSKEDFLPASVYYEKDTDLLLEQLIAYKKRQRLTDKEMTAMAEKYTTVVTELETRVTSLSKSASTPLTDRTTIQEVIRRIEEGQKTANKIGKELAYLENRVASDRLDGQKEVQDMRTRVTAAEAGMAEKELVPPRSPAAQPKLPTTYSPTAKKLMDAVARARTELEDRERALTSKDKALATLQVRFNDIQRRLQFVQAALLQKNTEIQVIQSNLQDTPKP